MPCVDSPRRGHGLWLLLVAAAFGGCSERVVVGYETDTEIEVVSGVGGVSSTAGGATGTDTDTAVSTGGSRTSTTGETNLELPQRGDLIWQADFETGDDSQWSEGGQGGPYVANAAQYLVTEDHQRSGSYALRATIDSIGQALPQAVLLRDLTRPEAYYSAWFCVRENYDTSYWVIMKFRGEGPFLGNTETGDRFDIDLSTSEDDGRLHLQLDEHGGDAWLSSIPVPIDAWFQIEAFYRSTPEANGRLVVWQDGVQVFDTGERPTAPSAEVSFGVGVAAWRVSPLPASVWIDDVSIYDAR